MFREGHNGNREEDNLQEQTVRWSHVWGGIGRYVGRQRERERERERSRG